MEENNVEHVASYMRWVYFRKKASGGDFDIYSDIDSKIKHYQRINRFWAVLTIFELIIGLSNIFIGIDSILRSDPFYFNLIGGALCVLLGNGYFVLGHPLRKKIGKLKKEKVVTE